MSRTLGHMEIQHLFPCKKKGGLLSQNMCLGTLSVKKLLFYVMASHVYTLLDGSGGRWVNTTVGLVQQAVDNWAC